MGGEGRGVIEGDVLVGVAGAGGQVDADLVGLAVDGDGGGLAGLEGVRVAVDGEGDGGRVGLWRGGLGVGWLGGEEGCGEEGGEHGRG